MTIPEDIVAPETSPSAGRLQTSGSAAAEAIVAWRWWLVPAALALTLAFVFEDAFIGDWDALDYAVLAVQGRPSSMILGRTLFIFFNHTLWYVAHELFDLQPERAYLLFKYAVIFQSPLAIIAWWRLSHDLTHSVRASTVAALLLVLSPFFIIYSGQAMTEIPSLLLLAVALIIHLKGVRSRRLTMVVLGAALLGVSVNVREAAILYFPWLIVAPFVCRWKWERRKVATMMLACLVFLVCAFGPFVFMLATNVGNYRWAWHGWVESTHRESARHPVSFDNFGALLRYFFIAAPLALVAFPVALIKEWKQRGLTPLAALAIVGVLANLSLIVHYSVVINGRYMLTGLPALTPLVADYFMESQTAKLQSERYAFWSVVAGVVFIALVAGFYAWPFSRTYTKDHSLAKEYQAQLALVPRDAVMICGSQTVAVTYWRGLGAGEWDVIGSGSGWPGAKLPSVIAKSLAAGRRIFLDADPRWWSPDGWQQQATVELIDIESRFHFRRVSDTIYEIRPPEDGTARDLPHLSYWLLKKSH